MPLVGEISVPASMDALWPPMPDFETVALTLGSLLAGFVNAIAGGGGLVTLPVLLGVFPQAEPAVLFGTNKAAMICGTATAAVDYARHVRLPWATLLPALVVAFLGGVIGAWLVTLVSPDGLRRALPFMLATVFLVTLFGGPAGDRHAPRFGPRAEAAIAAAIALVMGLYDGFFGPGTGSFLIFLLVRLLGFDYLHAAASTKVLNMTTNLGALAFLGTAGHVWWRFFLPMAVANVVGASLGTRLALRHGSRLVRIVFLMVVAALILKTGYDAYAG